MYNPYGTFRSWLAIKLITQFASRVHPEYTLRYALLTAEDTMEPLSTDAYNKQVELLVNEYGSTFLSALAIMISSWFIFFSSLIHEVAHVDFCLEITRIYLNVVQ